MECNVCGNFHNRPKCPACGAFIAEIAKIFGRPFHRRGDFGTAKLCDIPMPTVRYINSGYRGTGRKHFTCPE